jgi:hypothetical protein
LISFPTSVFQNPKEMPEPSEPERYSIDEMMDRLKNRPTEDSLADGELVTRADGSQAIRVRKRKRRSHQPHKEEKRIARRARMIQVSGALILIMLALLAAGGAIVYGNSTPFRQGLIAKITAASGAATELQQFRMSPASANANLVILKWPGGNVLSELAVRSVRAEIRPSSFLGKTMVGEEIKSTDANLFLRIPDSSAPARESATAEPGAVRFKRYATTKLNVTCGDPSAPLLRMFESDASFEPDNAGGRPQLLLNRGHLALPGWPKLDIDRAHIEFRGPEIDIISMRFRHEADLRGRFEITGTVLPYQNDRQSSLAVEIESYPIAGIAGPELGKLFTGRIDTLSSAKSNYLSFAPGANPQGNLTIDFRNSLGDPLEVSGFPFLIGIAQILDDDWFERPVFETDATGTLRRSNGNITLGNLNLENKDRIAIRGTLAKTQGGSLAGKLEVGLAEAMVKSAGNRRLEAMFGPAREGFRWLEVAVSGSATAPADTFRQQYEAAAAAPAESR